MVGGVGGEGGVCQVRESYQQVALLSESYDVRRWMYLRALASRVNAR